MQGDKLWIRIRDSFWFLPTVYGLASIILVSAITFVDTWIIANFKNDISSIWLTSKGVSKELYGALVTAILTMTTISFSVIMVVLTTYSTQFSPRTLQDFMRSTTTQHMLGVYCFGFVFALLHLVLVDKGDMLLGPILMAFIATIDLACFVYFIHHSARWIQVNNLIANIRNDGSKVIKHAYQNREFLEYEAWDENEISELAGQSKRFVKASKSGYVQKIEWKRLVNWAKHQHCVIRISIQVGDFVTKDLPVMCVIKTGHCNDIETINQFLIIGNERTDLQDVEFTLQKLVEIALRAISPAVNDPHTAINCINRIGALLTEIGSIYKEIHYITDNDQKLRIINNPKKYEDYLYKSFYQIRHYGNDDISIIYSMIEVLYKIAIVSDNGIKQRIWNFHSYIVDSIEWHTLSDMDRQHLESIYSKLKSCCR